MFSKPKTRWWLYILLTVLLSMVMLPFVWMLLGSVKPNSELMASPPSWLPQNPSLANFQLLFEKASFGTYFVNSVVVAVVVVAANLMFSAMLGYALARLDFPGKRIVFGAVMGSLMIPGLVLFIPQFILAANLHLIGNLSALMLPFLVQPFGVFLMRQFFIGLPKDLAEAARIDGAGELGVFFRIYLPLAVPAFATLGILTFLGSWNNFLWPLVVSVNESTYTLPVGLALVANGQHQADYGLLLAGATVVVAPILVVFLFLQRFFIEGIATSGIK
ncbi:carbohydrate ABC transporter permease [Propionicimonas sp.]|uniref:carbohydrate ABC transporter permease n=1 Tax=Propionicimonas sp. TaxID=1955623 RepID=UPI00181DC6BD|nr:carbohydrate ABC transporter permease [Propionicimonas sp.]MBU3976111.1 carbohydrate ABC transporter permease [Actinomycetota bacterium]MBA3020924.1 carbohydrate ABC transporter permease [Propionicimonas sp.]MBU3985301.1 carbohydrate ABC transporter permease [Actinomycetota bacterium]MBU4008291.1 carbohydrate ABC transporter permease [Actinomycetota bacterium]MBU4064495.1 carbohydrate ABC transporter permease [Actinomycetota bacterium]